LTRSYHVQLAYVSGYSRPVVESHIASLLSRGAGTVRDKGFEGAVVVRIRQLMFKGQLQPNEGSPAASCGVSQGNSF
jgi:hypothetical protein